jgi:hypothetical protein
VSQSIHRGQQRSVIRRINEISSAGRDYIARSSNRRANDRQPGRGSLRVDNAERLEEGGHYKARCTLEEAHQLLPFCRCATKRSVGHNPWHINLPIGSDDVEASVPMAAAENCEGVQDGRGILALPILADKQEPRTRPVTINEWNLEIAT